MGDVTDLGVLATQGAQTVIVICSASLAGSAMGNIARGGRVGDRRLPALGDARRHGHGGARRQARPTARSTTCWRRRGCSSRSRAAFCSPTGRRSPRRSASSSSTSSPTSASAPPRAGSSRRRAPTALQRITRARWTQPYQIAAGTPLADAINAAVLSRWPAAQTAISAATVPNSLGAQAIFDAGGDSDPWADICSLATSFGYLLSFSAGRRTAGAGRHAAGQSGAGLHLRCGAARRS